MKAIQDILKGKHQKKEIFTALFTTVVGFLIFKVFYPRADFFSDSYSFILAARENMNVNLWPIGYSKFLRAIHFVSGSDTFLTFTQYLFLETCSFAFYLSVKLFFNISGVSLKILFIFLFFNPLFLYLSNYISSESIFIGISLCWFTSLLWVINKPSAWPVIFHTIFILLAFTIRYNAMYYPLVSVIIITVSKLKIELKIAAILLMAIGIGNFVSKTTNEMYAATGTKQFSILSGWHLANSALYMYPYISVDTNNLTSPETKKLNRYVSRYFARMGDEAKKITPADEAYFLKDPKGPLKYYMRPYLKMTDNEDIFHYKAWAKVSPVFKEYGKSLITTHLYQYTQYYLLPNTVNYFIPPLEKLKMYNLGMDSLLSPIAEAWFSYPSKEMKSASKDFQNKLLFIYPSIFLVINICFPISVIMYLFKRKKERFSNITKLTVVSITTFWLINMGFSIISAPIVFRYQAFPLIILLSGTILLVEILDTSRKSIKKDSKIISGLTN